MPGALEIAPAIRIGHRQGEFDGFVALGCVVRGETTHYETVCNDSSRALMLLGLEGANIGNGILTVENLAQAEARGRPGGAGQGRRGRRRRAAPDRASAPDAPARARHRLRPAGRGGSMTAAADARRRMRSAARLFAVQALYQMEMSGRSAPAVVREFQDHRFGERFEDHEMAEGDPDHFRALVEGAVEAQSRIDQMTDRALVAAWPLKRIDPTLRALFRAAGAELDAGQTPPKVVINEFVEVARAFFPEGARAALCQRRARPHGARGPAGGVLTPGRAGASASGALCWRHHQRSARLCPPSSASTPPRSRSAFSPRPCSSASCLWFDVAGLAGLIARSPDGWLALGLLWLFNGIVFAGAQAGIAVFLMAEGEDGGGRRDGVEAPPELLAIPVEASPRR